MTKRSVLGYKPTRVLARKRDILFFLPFSFIFSFFFCEKRVVFIFHPAILRLSYIKRLHYIKHTSDFSCDYFVHQHHAYSSPPPSHPLLCSTLFSPLSSSSLPTRLFSSIPRIYNVVAHDVPSGVIILLLAIAHFQEASSPMRPQLRSLPARWQDTGVPFSRYSINTPNAIAESDAIASPPRPRSSSKAARGASKDAGEHEIVFASLLLAACSSDGLTTFGNPSYAREQERERRRSAFGMGDTFEHAASPTRYLAAAMSRRRSRRRSLGFDEPRFSRRTAAGKAKRPLDSVAVAILIIS